MDPAIVAALVLATGALAGTIIGNFYSHRVAQQASKDAQDLAHEVEQYRQAYAAVGRLHGATGALRLQLFLSSRSFARRVAIFRKNPYEIRATDEDTYPSEYHAAGLLIYRLLRPLTVSYLIEQQTYYADLLLEPTMVDLLRFNHAAFEMLSGDRLGSLFGSDDPFKSFNMESCHDPKVGRPPATASTGNPIYQRVRASYLRSAAAALVVPSQSSKDDSSGQCMTHYEFLRRWESPKKYVRFHQDLMPVKIMVDRFSPELNPVLWLRLVGYAFVCRWFHNQVSEDAKDNAGIIYAPVIFDVGHMLAAVDERYEDESDDCEVRFRKIVDGAL
jgi:hypothetical protein